ncbi:response regulator NasT [Caldalkalibacillus uzonensis]|uniref:Response regulator NasT n=1 Tax=Caldalkalibacillus uzonensis TaxID=353224 RepID=A0ABU0CQP7_9BACI|nr:MULTISPECIES: response regulator [Caldalkalibacillus]MDQ0338736.1 response regulator NasT [Caldalkalibacillus uzonensis]GGK29762.1 Fis family transcriptional regulator [Caldalkalibacillus thermarum]
MATRILIVEDQAIVRMDLKEILEEAGFEVVGEASDGEQGIELAHRLKPDLVIMDIKMPRLNGLKASQIITRSINLPILILTAYSQREFVEKAKQSHVLGYLIKPISEKTLIPAVEIALAQVNRMRKVAQEVDETKQQLENRKLIERAKGLLMEHKQISESKAYALLRQTSMKKRISMVRLAKHILSKYGEKSIT